MKRTILVTGAAGFIARNLLARLEAVEDVTVHAVTRATSPEELTAAARAADVVFHLAGVNRPQREEEFHRGNAGFAEQLVAAIRDNARAPAVVFASSIQAAQDNPYGRSKLAAENILHSYATESRARVAIFRLKNVFGKWSRPNYNSVVATFCYNIARDLPITVNDPERELELVYIDDVVDALLQAADEPLPLGEGGVVRDSIPVSVISLGDLACLIQCFREMKTLLMVPDLSGRLHRQLYATYLSFVDGADWAYSLNRKADERGDLAEFIKSRCFGQIFVSRTRPGVTRGNHYHNTKAEKFLVLQGIGRIRFMHAEGGDVTEFVVRGEEYRVLDIPPGYTHSITNEGEGEMITLFWASEVFDPSAPDTVFLPVGGREAGS